MINLEDYLQQYNALIGSEAIFDEPINEGKIKDGIKKVWRWLTRKKKRKNKDNEENYRNNSFINTEFDSDYNSGTGFEFFDNSDGEHSKIICKEYSYNKLYDKIKNNSKLNKIDKNVNTDKQNVKVIISKNVDKNELVGILVFLTPNKSQYSKIDDKFNNYAHVICLHIADKYINKTKIHKNILLSVRYVNKDDSELRSIKGFTLNEQEYQSNDIFYNKIGFSDQYSEKNKNINLYYCSYDNIKKPFRK